MYCQTVLHSVLVTRTMLHWIGADDKEDEEEDKDHDDDVKKGWEASKPAP